MRMTRWSAVAIATAGILGYFTRPMRLPLRLAVLLAGVALMVPTRAFAGAAYVESIGFVVGAALVGSEILAGRRMRQLKAAAPLSSG